MASEKMSNRSKIGSLDSEIFSLEVRPLKMYDPKMIKNDQNQSKKRKKLTLWDPTFPIPLHDVGVRWVVPLEIKNFGCTRSFRSRGGAK